MNYRNTSTSNFSKRVEGLDDVYIAAPATDKRLLVFDLPTGVYNDTRTISHDGTFVSNSDLNIPTEKAIKSYIDAITLTEQEPTGFAQISRTGSTLSFTDGTLTLAINPTGASFDYWIKGIKISSTGASKVIANTEGLHYIYFNGATLSETTTFSVALIKDYAYVAAVYWDVSAAKHLYLGDERHDMMEWQTHWAMHNTIGTRYLSGLGLSNLSTDQDGSLNIHAEIGVANGSIIDEDLQHDISAKVKSTYNYFIYYMTGGSADWNAPSSDTAPILSAAPAGRLYYNQYVGAAWQLTQVGNLQFALYHILATNDYSATRSIISIMGQNTYNSIIAARDGAAVEVNSLITSGLPMEEMVFLGTLIYQTSDAYANSWKARLRQFDTGIDYVDWRERSLSPANSANSHSILDNLLSDDHPQYPLLDTVRSSSTNTNLTLPTIHVTGKATIDGLIDPTGIEFTTQAANPGIIAANTLWLDSTDNSRIKHGAERIIREKELKDINSAHGIPLDVVENLAGRTFNEGTRLFTITHSSYPYIVYISGVCFKVTGSMNTTISDTEGLHIIYFKNNAGTLQLTSSYVLPNDDGKTAMINNCLLAQIYWSSATTGGANKGIQLDSPHLVGASKQQRFQLSFQSQTTINRSDSCLLGDFTIGDGSLLDHVLCSMSTGFITRWEHRTGITAKLKTDSKRILYYEWLAPASANLVRIVENTNGAPCITTGTGRLAYNLLTAGQFSLAEIASNKYVLVHVYVQRSVDSDWEYIFIIGQAEYDNQNLAAGGAVQEINNLGIDLSSARTFGTVGSIVFHTKDSYANAYKAKIVQTVGPLGTNINYVDHRRFSLATAPSLISRHAQLQGLEDGNEDHLNLGVLESARTLPTTNTNMTLPLLTNNGTKFIPVAANPGDANTLWSDSGNSNKLKKSASTVVLGPTTSVDNTIPRFDSTGGNLLQTSSIAIDDTDNITGVHNFTGTGDKFIFGDSTEDENKIVHFQAKKDITLYLEGDTDGSLSTDNPVIIMDQEAGVAAIRMVLTSADDFLISNSRVGGGTDHILFYTNQSHTNNVNAPPTGFAGGNLQLKLDGANTRVEIPTALLLTGGNSINEFSIDGTLADNSDNACPTEKAVKTYVDSQYTSGTHNTNWVSNWAAPQAGNIIYSTSGNIKNLTIPTTRANGDGVTTTTIAMSTVLPAALRPTVDHTYRIMVEDNAVRVEGQAWVYTTGNIIVSYNFNSNFTVTAASMGMFAFTMTYT